MPTSKSTKKNVVSTKSNVRVNNVKAGVNRSKINSNNVKYNTKVRTSSNLNKTKNLSKTKEFNIKKTTTKKNVNTNYNRAKTTNTSVKNSVNKVNKITNVNSINNNIKSHNNNINNTMNKKKKRKLKKSVYFYGDIIIIILIICALFMIFNKKNKGNDNNIDNNINQNIIDNNNNNNDNTVINDNVDTNDDDTMDSKDEKLLFLNNINEKLDFFKDEYLDRYVKYKKENPELDDEKVIVYVNIGLDKEFYKDVSDSPNKYTNTVLANKLYYLGDDYVPKNLEKIDDNYTAGDKYMEHDAKVAFEKMAKDAKKEGYNIRATSTYRSYKYQNNLYNNYAASDGTKKADTYSARPGYSEHQTGLAVDVDNIKVSYTKFGNTKEFTWMKENAYKYGFILRYTKENEFITGYINEPWHYRYVGKEIATYIQNHPMTYEEYYVRFLEK